MTRQRQKQEGKRPRYFALKGPFRPRSPGLIGGIWRNGKFTTVEQMIESAQKAAGKGK